jgi:molybdopterin synthase catalytic subunit
MSRVRPIVRIAKGPIRPDRVLYDVRTPAAGGIVSFVGTVRNRSHGSEVTKMELEAAAELALADLTRIATEAGKRFAVSKISVAHRIGKLRIGDVIVAISVSAPHRADAFRACKFVIDELKKTTPIWKKEFSGKKGHWIEGER